MTHWLCRGLSLSHLLKWFCRICLLQAVICRADKIMFWAYEPCLCTALIRPLPSTWQSPGAHTGQSCPGPVLHAKICACVSMGCTMLVCDTHRAATVERDEGIFHPRWLCGEWMGSAVCELCWERRPGCPGSTWQPWDIPEVFPTLPTISHRYA